MDWVDPEQPFLDWQGAHEWAGTVGESFFCTDLQAVADRYAALRDGLRTHHRRTHIAYAYKCNYTPAILGTLAREGCWAEVVSELEWQLAGQCGVDPREVVVNGPARVARFLCEAMRRGATVNLDNTDDVQAAIAVARAHPQESFRVGLRVGGLPLPQRASGPTPEPQLITRLGIDPATSMFADVVSAIRAEPNLQLAGLHAHQNGRTLARFLATARPVLTLAEKLLPADGYVDLGGGVPGGGQGDDRVEIDDFVDGLGPVLARELANRPQLTVILEPGAALVNSATQLFARVRHMRPAGARHVVVVAASVFNSSPYGRRVDHRIRVLAAPTTARRSEDSPPAPRYDVAGRTADEGDYLALDRELEVAPGDFLCWARVGAYARYVTPDWQHPNIAVLARTEVTGQWRVAVPAEPAAAAAQRILAGSWDGRVGGGAQGGQHELPGPRAPRIVLP